MISEEIILFSVTKMDKTRVIIKADSKNNKTLVIIMQYFIFTVDMPEEIDHANQLRKTQLPLRRQRNLLLNHVQRNCKQTI